MKYPERINKIIPRVLNELGIEERMKNYQAVERWIEIVGKRIAEHAKAIGVDSENLFVEVDNPMWQSQLFLMKDKIIKKLKNYSIKISDIKFSIAKTASKNKECYDKKN